MKAKRHFLLLTCAAMVTILVFIDVASAARWNYRAWRNGSITVWGTRNCRRVTGPLTYRPVQAHQTYSGYLPWYCNDFLVRYYWGPPCHNVTWTKYVPQPCPMSCWRQRWIIGPLYEYLEDYVPYRYMVSEVIIPSLGDPQGHLTGNQELYIFVDMGIWLDWGQPFIDPGPGIDPNTVYFDFTNGYCSTLPGFTAMRVDPPGTPIEDLIIFNPDADPMGYPFEVTRPDLLLTGRLYLQDVQRFDGSPYDGTLIPADNDYSGKVDLQDLARFAELWLREIVPCEDADHDGYFDRACGGMDCDDNNPSVHPGAVEICDGKDNDCDGVMLPEEMDADADGFKICDGDCDDNNPNVHPGAEEICSDGLDNDCDGSVDEDCGYCGDGICQPWEDRSCPDCYFCGDGICQPGEEGMCSSDCGYCGDGICQPWEDPYTCPDCGYCGDGICQPWEDPYTCPDCGYCGDGICQSWEDPYTCQDCQTPCNGNGICEPWEDPYTCPDCYYCGDGICQPGEEGVCLDCPTMCGNGICELGEGGWCPDCCGNGICEMGEEVWCPDCGYCGDGICQPWENPYACQDCQPPCNYNGTCDPWEDPYICQECQTPCNYNGTCEPWEDLFNCPDCQYPTYCGDGTCDPGEEGYCPEDCLM